MQNDNQHTKVNNICLYLSIFTLSFSQINEMIKTMKESLNFSEMTEFVGKRALKEMPN